MEDDTKKKRTKEQFFKDFNNDPVIKRYAEECFDRLVNGPSLMEVFGFDKKTKPKRPQKLKRRKK